MQQCLELLETDEKRKPIFDLVMQRFTFFAKDQNGSQVIQKCIDVAQEKWRKTLIENSFTYVEELINDKNGNFIYKVILEKHIDHKRAGNNYQAMY